MSESTTTTSTTPSQPYLLGPERRIKRQKKSTEDVSYYQGKFNEFVVDEHCHANDAVKNLEHELAKCTPGAIKQGNRCRLIPELVEIYGATSMSRIGSGPVTLTTEAAPVLMRYLRLQLALDVARRRVAQLDAFMWEAGGDDEALDWCEPATWEAFNDLFTEMLEQEPSVAREFDKAGFTINDLIVYDQANETGRFFLTIESGAPNTEGEAEPEDETNE